MARWSWDSFDCQVQCEEVFGTEEELMWQLMEEELLAEEQQFGQKVAQRGYF